nr:hypothetical protein BaRGS_014782 [Batillaria attramentaria]
MCMLDRSDIARGTEKRQSCSSVDAWSVGTLGSSEDGLDLLGSVEDLIKRSSSPVSFTLTSNTSLLCFPVGTLGTLGSSEDGLDLLGSVEDLIKRSSSPVSFTLTSNASLLCFPVGTLGTLGSSEDGLDLLGSVEDLIKRSSSPVSFTVTCAPPDTAEEPPAAAVPENFLRPKSHSVVAATFLTRSHLTGGHSAYSDILNRNVRLWKCRVAHAQDGRPREAVLEEEG